MSKTELKDNATVNLDEQRIAREHLARWQEDFGRLKLARDELAAELKAFYPDAAAKIAAFAQAAPGRRSAT